MTEAAKRTFFKYHDVDTVKTVLRNCTRRWSSPSEFNDPFDNDISIRLTDNHDLLARNQVERTLGFLTSDAPIPGNDENPHLAVYEWMRQNRRGEITEELKDALFKAHRTHAAATAEKFNAGLEAARVELEDAALFCVSETKDNILMWSHYTRHHRGAVLEFQCVEDSPLLIARPVRYCRDLPVLDQVPIGALLLTETFLDTLTYTKSVDWAYEKEWRVASTHRDKTKTIEDFPYNPRELKTVYLGCKMLDTHKQEIIAIVRDKYPGVKIFQATRHKKLFGLEFSLVT